MSEPRDGDQSNACIGTYRSRFFILMWGGYYIGYYGGDWNGNGLADRPSAGKAKTGPVENPMARGQGSFPDPACSAIRKADSDSPANILH